MSVYNTRNIGVMEYDVNGNLIKTWSTISQVSKELKCCRHRIAKAIDQPKIINNRIWKSIPDPDLNGELWKDISQLARISNKGRFWSKNGRKHYGTKKSNYLSVFSGKKHYYVHRLVAIHFLEEPATDQTQVDHIDGNSLNNKVENLEWVTPSQNLVRMHQRKRNQ